jgi:hypothetical protein
VTGRSSSTISKRTAARRARSTSSTRTGTARRSGGTTAGTAGASSRRWTRWAGWSVTTAGTNASRRAGTRPTCDWAGGRILKSRCGPRAQSRYCSSHSRRASISRRPRRVRV